MTKPHLDFLSRFLGGLGAGALFAAIFLLARYYAIGTNSPDPKTARTYPIAAHGTLYVTAEQVHLFYGLLVAFVVLEIASFFIFRATKRL